MKWMRRITALLLCLCLLTCAVGAAAADEIAAANAGLAAMMDTKAGKILAQQEMVPAGSPTSDWLAMAFAMGGAEENYDAYLGALEDHVTGCYAQNGCLDSLKATEYHRIALTVLALGGDPTAFGEDQNGEPVDLIADGTWNFAGELGAQGLNGWIFALITLDAKDYEVPAGAKYTREDMVAAITAAQGENGGFGLTPGCEDADLTGMALQALAPYEAGREAVEKAVEWLASRMTDTCSFESYGAEAVESAAQAVIGLCAAGVDPETDERFLRGGMSLLDHMETYRLPDGTYLHQKDETSGNLMATEQVLLAKLAVERLRQEGTNLYDFTDYTAPESASGMNTALLIGCGAAVLALLAAGVLILGRKGKKHHAEADN